MTNDEWDGGRLEVASCTLLVAGWPKANVGLALVWPSLILKNVYT